jgi:hypothetical protein
MIVSKKMAKPKGMDLIYVDTGNKVDYAACVEKDGNLVFCGWIAKFCVKDTDTIVKKTKEEIGL